MSNAVKNENNDNLDTLVSPAPKKNQENVRSWLKENDFSGFLMIRTDEYQGEYLPSYAERLYWLTGFSGSAGVVIEGQNTSAVFVDGRYTIQVQDEIDPSAYTVQHLTNQPATTWIEQNFSAGDIIAYDPWLFTVNQLATFKKSADKVGAVLEPTENPIDMFWDTQPPAPKGKVVLHPMEYAGVSHLDKIKNIAATLQQNKLDSAIYTMTCSIAWLFNIRGADVPCNPVALCYAIVKSDATAVIYIDLDKVDSDITDSLGNTVTFKDFNTVAHDFCTLTGRVGMDMALTPLGLVNIAQDSDADVVHFSDLARQQKSSKNPTEQQAMRACHIRDGVVMAKFLHWVDTTPVEHQNEWVNARKLEEFRRSADKFKDISFEPISGFAANGAICHYRVQQETALQLETDSVYLIDSGSQYTDGTTDITRTVALGTPSQDQKHNFTLVLQGLINLHTAKFPNTYTLEQLDCMARLPLFKEGKNYDHGTGHGVGAALNVHEGPHSFSVRGRDVTIPNGCIMSNEPGYYPAGEYGIRIENLMIAHHNDNGWVEWENITWCPIDTRLIKKSLLSPSEVEWVNDYHAQTLEKLSGDLQENTEVLHWLQNTCKPI